MRLRSILSICMMALIPFGAMAQGKGKGKGNKKPKTAKIKHSNNGKAVVKTDRNVYYGKTVKKGPPAWAPAHGYRAKQHVYFPDYYTFYDPYRDGYSYWNNGGWSFSSILPAFLSNIDLGKARMQLLTDIPVTTRPETRYSTYIRQYPAQPVGVAVPVPVIR